MESGQDSGAATNRNGRGRDCQMAWQSQLPVWAFLVNLNAANSRWPIIRRQSMIVTPAIQPAVVPSTIAMQRGEYGYDAPYALLIFGSLAVVSGLGAAIAWWRMPTQAAAPITLYFVLFLANTTSFFYTTRRGKFLEWEGILDRIHLRGDEMVLDLGAAEERCWRPLHAG